MVSDRVASVARADLADWVTVAAYLFAAFLSARAGSAVVGRQRRERMVWRTIAVLLVLLAINELMDLQTLLTSVGRAHAQANGWYADRREVQLVFLLVFGMATAVSGVTILWLVRDLHAMVWLAVFGLLFIGAFVLLRAASFHHLDEVLGGGLPEFTWGSMQEMAGILIVASAAVLYARGSRRGRQNTPGARRCRSRLPS